MSGDSGDGMIGGNSNLGSLLAELASCLEVEGSEQHPLTCKQESSGSGGGEHLSSIACRD